MQVRRGEVDDYLTAGDMVLQGLKGGDGPQEAFLDGGVRQADQMDPDTGDHVHLHGDGDCVYADALRSDDVYKHVEKCFSLIWPAKR